MSTRQYGTGGGFSRVPNINNYQAGFDGNKYTHATIISLDNNLNLQWSFTFQTYSRGGREELMGKRLTKYILNEDDSINLILPNEIDQKKLDRNGIQKTK